MKAALLRSAAVHFRVAAVNPREGSVEAFEVRVVDSCIELRWRTCLAVRTVVGVRVAAAAAARRFVVAAIAAAEEIAGIVVVAAAAAVGFVAAACAAGKDYVRSKRGIGFESPGIGAAAVAVAEVGIAIAAGMAEPVLVA